MTVYFCRSIIYITLQKYRRKNGQQSFYHGSSEIIRIPLLSKGKLTNDYGQGFYCTETRLLAAEWACTEGQDGYVNQVRLEYGGASYPESGREGLYGSSLAGLLVEYRKLRLSSPVMKQGATWLIRNFHTDLTPFDIVIGYRGG